VLRLGVDVTADPSMLTRFDHVVIATGAAYRFGLGRFATWALDSGAARWPGIARLLSNDRLRNWFYYRARRGTAARLRYMFCVGKRITVIGDAVKAGKSNQAIASAFEAALLPGSGGRAV